MISIQALQKAKRGGNPNPNMYMEGEDTWGSHLIDVT